MSNRSNLSRPLSAKETKRGNESSISVHFMDGFILGTDLNHGWLDGVVGMRGLNSELKIRSVLLSLVVLLVQVVRGICMAGCM
jgi:hypothetical protein